MKKLVKESLNEVISFTRGNSPLSTLDIGQHHFITSWLNKMSVHNYTINPDLTIDVEGDVNLYNKNLVKFPEFIKFNHVSDVFHCFGNNLTLLEGCPKYVRDDFNCNCNNLTSLEGCPISVGGDFSCKLNKVKFSKEYVKKLCDVKGYIYV